MPFADHYTGSESKMWRSHSRLVGIAFAVMCGIAAPARAAEEIDLGGVILTVSDSWTAQVFSDSYLQDYAAALEFDRCCKMH